jgi:cytosine/adenosine deaminase-related metal-dependent hydrolase
LVEELRTAAILARVAAGQAHAVTAADIFSAATVGGARALGRDDLGRITPGAKADLQAEQLRADREGQGEVAQPTQSTWAIRSMEWLAGQNKSS